MPGYSLYRITVKAAIVEDGKVLILRRSMRDGKPKQGLWELPGGGVEKGESPDFALLREVDEETCLHVTEHKPVLVWHRSGEEGEIVGITYACKVSSMLPKLSSEHCEYKWAEAEEIDGFEFIEGLKDELKYLIESGFLEY